MELELGTDTEPVKKIVLALLGVIVVIILLALMFTVAAPKMVGVSFDPSATVSPNAGTTLVVEERNILKVDAKNVVTTVTPESDQIIVIGSSSKTEEVIGQGAYRKIEFPLSVAPTATPGNYKIEITVKMNEVTETAITYIEVVVE